VKILIELLIIIVCALIMLGPAMIEKATGPFYTVTVIDETGEVNAYTVTDTTGYRTSTNKVQIKQIQP